MILASCHEKSSQNHGSHFRVLAERRGFTLLELVVAMAVSTIVLLGIYASHALQQDTLRNQTMVVDTQQNLRGALTLMQQELLMAGYNPREVDNTFGVENVSSHNGNASIWFSGDFGADPSGDNGTLDLLAGERIEYYLHDLDDDGNLDLGRRVNGTGVDIDDDVNLMAPNIEALGMAFAYDSDGDGELDTDGGAVIWAIDFDNDNFLDRNLDTNTDGMIDENDNPDGVALPDSIPPEDIRAVRIWLLGRTEGIVRGYRDPETYVIAGRRLTPDDSFQRRLLTTTIRLRNMGL